MSAFKRWKVFYRQRPIKGGRLHLTASCEEAIRKAVEREAKRYGASMSFVMSVALADALGITLKYEEDYRQVQQARGTAPRQAAPRQPAEEVTAH